VLTGIWWGRPEGRKPLGRPKRRLEDNIKIYLENVGWGHRLDRTDSGWGRVTCAFVYNKEFSDSIKCGEFLD
jgi:hypothetical protein